MAEWRHTVPQKRILTRIISALQPQISRIEKGIEDGHFSTLPGDGSRCCLRIPLRDLIKKGNNYNETRKALLSLKEIDGGIILPEISKSGNRTEPPLMLKGWIEDAVIRPYDRHVDLWLERKVVGQLVRPFNGLTSLSEKIIFQTDNRYTQRLYELISHWKDKEVFTMSIEKLRKYLVLGDKYPIPSQLINGIIRPVEKELLEIGEVYFNYSCSKLGARTTHVNFAIKQKLTVKKEQEINLKLREQITNILRIRCGFQQEHFSRIQNILSDEKTLRHLNEKVAALWDALDRRPGEIINIPNWTIESILELNRKEMSSSQ